MCSCLNERLAEHSIIIFKQLNKINNTGAQTLDSSYHRTLKFTYNNLFDVTVQRLRIMFSICNQYAFVLLVNTMYLAFHIHLVY